MPTAAEWAEIRRRSNANKKKGKGRHAKAKKAAPAKKKGRKGHKAISASAARGKIPKTACTKTITRDSGIAKSSIRWRQATKAGGPKSTWMRMGCPTKDFKGGKCHGLMKMLEVVKGTPKGQGCPTGYHRK